MTLQNYLFRQKKNKEIRCYKREESKELEQVVHGIKYHRTIKLRQGGIFIGYINLGTASTGLWSHQTVFVE